MLIIVGLSFLKDIIGAFGVDGTLPFWSKGPSVCRKSLELDVRKASVQVICHLSCRVCSCTAGVIGIGCSC